MSSSSSLPASPPARELLRRFAVAWAADALRGGRPPSDASGPDPAILLVDPFAGADYPIAEPEAPLGIAVAERLLALKNPGDRPEGVRVLLGDEDPHKVQWLTAAGQRAGLGDVLATAEEADEDARSGPVLVREGSAREWTAAPRALAAACQALVVLDPPSAAELPWETTASLVAQRRAEVLIHVPTAELRRLARFPATPLADLPPYGKRAVDGLSRFLGDRRHSWFLDWRAGAEEELEERVVTAFRRRLEAEVGETVCRVTVPAGEAESFDLLLVRAAGWRALRIDELLFEARCEGTLPWPGESPAWIRYERSADLQLFGDAFGGARRERHVDRVLVAHTLAERFSGRTLRLDLLLRSLAGQGLFPDDVRRALGDLRKDGRALFRSLAAEDCEIAFPSTRLRTSAVGRRRRTTDAELSLSLDPDSE